MNPGVEITYTLDGLTGTLVHGPSGSRLTTTPPKDNGGDGSSFSPTDLLAAAMLSCAITTLALVSKRDSLAFKGASGRVVKQMVNGPRRVGELTIEIRMPADTGDRERLEQVARECPVARSLAADVKVPFTFIYE